MNMVVLWQRLEGALVLMAGLALFGYADSALTWWLALMVLFAPDLSFFAYVMGPKVGSVIYNGVHLYAFGLGVLTAGLLLGQPMLAGLGALWLAHAGFDRMLGYGLKSMSGFSDTHLGRIGRAR